MDNPERELEPELDIDHILRRLFLFLRLLHLYPDENVRQNVDQGQIVDQYGAASVRQQSAPPLPANTPSPGQSTLLAEICIQILHSQPRCFWVLNDRNIRVVLN